MEEQATIVVVDDDQAMTSTVAEILRVAGYRVVTANRVPRLF
jgi:FixJ family two-component response regulator